MFRKIIRFLGSVVSGSPAKDEEPCPSVVLLLAAPIELSRETVLDLAAQAWGASENPPFIAGRPGRGKWLVRVFDVLFGLRSVRSRYRGAAPEANQVRQRAWERHRAWLEVDYPEGPKMPESEWPSCYKLLFLMANHLWDENCLGLYLPLQDVTIPNMGDLIASIRWAENNGTPLPFLHEPKEREA